MVDYDIVNFFIQGRAEGRLLLLPPLPFFHNYESNFFLNTWLTSVEHWSKRGGESCGSVFRCPDGFVDLL